MHYTSQGIVLQITDYSESSRILHIYTEKYGRKAFLARGIRKKTKKNEASAAAQPGSVVEVTAYENKKSSLDILKDLKVTNPFEEIPFSFHKTSILLFINEIVAKSIKEEEPNAELFHFLASEILLLDCTQEPLGEFPILFLVQFADKLGFCPLNNFHALHTPYFHLQNGMFTTHFTSSKETMEREESEWLHRFLTNVQHETYRPFGIPYNQRIKLLEQLVLFYRFHIPGATVLKSHEILHCVLQ